MTNFPGQINLHDHEDDDNNILHHIHPKVTTGTSITIYTSLKSFLNESNHRIGWNPQISTKQYGNDTTTLLSIPLHY